MPQLGWQWAGARPASEPEACRAEITDGTLTISNICAEAGVSRASDYRSPHASEIKQILDAPQTRRPEVEQLREDVRRLKSTERMLRSEHATQTRQLRDDLKTYANQIQARALHAAHLENDSDNITPAGHPPLTPRNTAAADPQDPTRVGDDHETPNLAPAHAT